MAVRKAIPGSEQYAREWLARGGVRATRQRITLARLLIGDGNHRHVSAESLHESAAKAGEAVSVATVYNALRRFAAVGLLREIRIDPDRSYFDTRTDDHAHFYWSETGVLEDAPDQSVRLGTLPPPPAGARIVGVDVVIRLQPQPTAQ